MRIKITIGGQVFQAILSHSPAAHDLVTQLPVTIQMADHGAVEKTGALPSPLSLEGQPDGADPDVGDLGYYAPGNDLVLYYGDQSYYPGIVILGRLEGGPSLQAARGRPHPNPDDREQQPQGRNQRRRQHSRSDLLIAMIPQGEQPRALSARSPVEGS